MNLMANWCRCRISSTRVIGLMSRCWLSRRLCLSHGLKMLAVDRRVWLPLRMSRCSLRYLLVMPFRDGLCARRGLALSVLLKVLLKWSRCAMMILCSRLRLRFVRVGDRRRGCGLRRKRKWLRMPLVEACLRLALIVMERLFLRMARVFRIIRLRLLLLLLSRHSCYECAVAVLYFFVIDGVYWVYL